MRSETTTNLFKSLAIAQGKLKKAAKDSSNPYFSSRYADLESVIDAMRDVFAAEGLSVIQSVDGESLVTTICHQSGECINSYVPLIITKKDMQAVGSAITYARRYGLAAACGISQTDDDGNACSNPEPKPSFPKITAHKIGTVDGRAQSQSTDNINDCMFSYERDKTLVVAAATKMGILPEKLTEHRETLRKFLALNATRDMTSIETAVANFFRGK